VNISSSLVDELRDKTYRDAYVASQIKILLPYEVRALRNARNWTQGELARRANMSQPRIAEIERPGKRSLNLDTLLRLASAFDVGLQVQFVHFRELADGSEGFDPDTFNVRSFDDEIEAAAREDEVAANLEAALAWISAASAREAAVSADRVQVHIPLRLVAAQGQVNLQRDLFGASQIQLASRIELGQQLQVTPAPAA
jgi:transcriptional regulator with XRE-family HTH domain